MRHGEVDLGAAKVDVPHVGGEPGEENLNIGPLPVPLHHPVDGERVPEVVNPNVERILGRFGNARDLASPAERVMNAVPRKEAADPRREEWRVPRRVRCSDPGKVLLKGAYEARPDWDETRFEELGVPHREQPFAKIQILPSQSHPLSGAQARRVDGEQKGAEHLGGDESCRQARRLRGVQKPPDLLFRVDVRLEGVLPARGRKPERARREVSPGY